MIVIAQVKENDWEKYKKIEREAFDEYHMTKEQFKELIKKGELWGAYEEGELVGYAIIKIHGEYAHLTAIAVEKKHRKKGVGDELMEFFLDEAERKGCKKAGLYVEEKNKPAINLYRLHGFEVKNEAVEYLIKKGDVEIAITEDEKEKYKIREVKKEAYEKIKEAFPEMNLEETKRHLESEKEKTIAMFEGEEIRAYMRYNPDKKRIRPIRYKKEEMWIMLKKAWEEERIDEHITIVIEKQEAIKEKMGEEKRTMLYMERKM